MQAIDYQSSRSLSYTLSLFFLSHMHTHSERHILSLFPFVFIYRTGKHFIAPVMLPLCFLNGQSVTAAVIRTDSACPGGRRVCIWVGVRVCVRVSVQVHLTVFTEKTAVYLAWWSASVYLIGRVEFQVDRRSKNTTKTMLRRQDIVKDDNYGNTAQF